MFNSSDSWLSYDITERSKCAKDLLSTVRLPLLSVPALDKILEKKSSFTISDECKNMIKAVLANKQQSNPFSCKITSRYCNQSNFNIIVCKDKKFRLHKVSNDVRFLFHAADSWLCHDITERRKYANDLLSKVRLPLLSIPALKQV